MQTMSFRPLTLGSNTHDHCQTTVFTFGKISPITRDYFRRSSSISCKKCHLELTREFPTQLSSDSHGRPQKTSLGEGGCFHWVIRKLPGWKMTDIPVIPASFLLGPLSVLHNSMVFLEFLALEAIYLTKCEKLFLSLV